MHNEELDILLSEEFACLMQQHAEHDPLEVALDKRIPHAALLATQLKYRRRALEKLPSYAAAGCILPPRAFEQSSSEAAAATKQLAGDSLLDLCCGLGVDARHFAQSFRRVVALERDPELAAITRENMRRLGVENVEVICSSAEEYLSHCDDHFSWIYADPDRRSAQGKKLVRLEDCSPNVVALAEELARVGDHLCLKNSPLFDVDEALRYYPTARIEAVSVGGECKEVVIFSDGTGPSLTARAVGLGSVETTPEERNPTPSPIEEFDPTRYRWLVLPDVALQKARLVCHHLRPHGFVPSENGFAFCPERPEGILGRLFEIESIEPFNPKTLKKRFAGQKAEILKRDFPLSMEDIRRQTGLRDGADLRFACTKIGKKSWIIRLK